VPVFESGFPAAKGAAEQLNIPITVAITTSNYVGRTFIQPGQNNRIKAVNGKHNIVGDEIIGKKIVVVDDSAIRMTTSKALVQELRDAGAKKSILGSPVLPLSISVIWESICETKKNYRQVISSTVPLKLLKKILPT